MLLKLELTYRDGKKMSKKLKNYPDPMDIVGKYGADCVRLFLLNSPVVRGENLRFREEGVRDILTNVILKWINSLNFYLGQVELFDHEVGKLEPKRAGFMYEHDAKKSGNVMDRWVLARCQTLIQHVDQEMSGMSLYLFVPFRDMAVIGVRQTTWSLPQAPSWTGMRNIAAD